MSQGDQGLRYRNGRRYVQSRLARYLLVPALLLLAALPAYLLAMFTLFVVPPMLTALCFRSDGKWLAGGEILRRLAHSWVAVPALLLAVIAPLRALVVPLVEAITPLQEFFREAHAPVYGLLEQTWGPLAVFYFDAWLGVYGVVAVFAMLLGHAIRRNLLATQVRNTVTSKARSVAMGMAELKGRAVAMPGQRAGQPIIRSNHLQSRDERHAWRDGINPFYLDDGTGMVLIDPRGASVGSDFNMFSINLHQISLPTVIDEREGPGERLMPGDPVLVYGCVQFNDDPATRETDPIVIRPRKSSLFRINYFDVFFLGSTSEQVLLENLRKSVLRGWAEFSVLLGLIAWLSIGGWNNVLQLTHLDADASTGLLRRIALTGELERPLPLPGDRRTSLAATLDAIERDEVELDDQLRALQRRQLFIFAIPALQRRLDDIENRNFGAAHQWLARLNRLPPDRITVDNGDGGDDETMIQRAILWRDGDALKISWRAHFNVGQPLNEHVTARSIVLTLKAATDGQSYRVVFPSPPGWSLEIGRTAFAALPVDDYEVTLRVRRDYAPGRFGRYDPGSRPLPTFRVRL